MCAFHASTNTQSIKDLVVRIIILTVYSSTYNMQHVSSTIICTK